MIKRGLFIWLFVANLTTFAQAPVLWDSLCCGKAERRIDCVYGVDTLNKLFGIGDFTYIGPINSWGIAQYNNQWDSVPGGIGLSQFGNCPNTMQYGDMAWYKNKLYIGDAEKYHNKQKTGCLGIWNGDSWDSLPGNPFLNPTNNANYDRPIYTLNVIDDTLYIGGFFDSVAHISTNGVVKFDGTNFHSLNFPSPPALGNIIYCLEKYKNEIYIGGNLTDSANAQVQKNLFRIFRYNGTTWYSVGNGVRGGNAQVNSMVVYKGWLYVAGEFNKADGNAGNNIMKWDGNNWASIPNGIEGTDGEVKKLLVHNNKLYVFGSFDNAGDIPASRMAVYDGSQWCDLGGQTYGYVKSATFFKDTLYVSGSFGYIGNQYIWYVAKRLAGNYHDTCGSVIPTDVSVKELKNELSFKIYPNPTNSIINIVDENNQPQNTTIQIQNNLGQLVFTSPFTNQINISNLSAGMYFLTIQDKNTKKTVKIIKQ